ncbi:MAG: hypothetical protein AAF542_07890 [Pseudomonadota bacterium]
MKIYFMGKAASLFAILMTSVLPCVSYASEQESSPVEISIGTIKTEAENAAVGFLVKYIENINEDYFISNAKGVKTDGGKGWLLDITPEIELQTGEEDSFNGLVAKMTANYISFDTTLVDDVEVPDTSKYFSVFPMSIGLESDRNFGDASLLVEAGYVPFNLGSKWRLGLDSKIGVFFQAGYKFEIESNAEVEEGGATDESEELTDNEIARIKLDAGTDLLRFKYSGEKSIALVPRARVWYDIVNDEVYHKLEAKLEFSIGKDRSFDFRYEDGSGAPNFNEGSQFSANLTIMY